MGKKQKSISKSNSIYLCAPVNALVEGLYEQKIPFTQVKRYGDFGLGTFNNLDGEMVMLDSEIYQITASGDVRKVDDRELTPFACVTFYKPLTQDKLESEMLYSEFLEWLNGLLPSTNIFYAIRIDGYFSYIKLRSVPKQENYRPLIDVASDQQIFIFNKIEGTMAGFFTPAFMSSLSVPGFHLHFLSNNRLKGGHVLECIPNNIKVGIQFLSSLELALPISLDYLTWNFCRKTEQDLYKIEK